MRYPLLAALVAWHFLACAASLRAVTVTFDDLSLGPESAENGAGLTPYATGTAFGETENRNRFASGGVTFENRYIPAFASWSRWAYSNRTDTVTAGFANDLSAFAGGGAGGSAHFGVSFLQTNSLLLGSGQDAPVSVAVTNVTYPALSMRDGDGFAKKFGGASGDDPDFFLLEIVGIDAGGQETGTVPFHLADFRFADNGMDYIVDTWETVDLTPLGNGVRTLEFRLSSSDNGQFGMNTPAYFAIDNLVVVPEPRVAMCLLLAGALLLGRRRVLVLCVLAASTQGESRAGSFPPAAGESGSTAVPFDDPRIAGWATGVASLVRGPVDIAFPDGAAATYGSAEDALGAATDDVFDVVSLGDGGSITLTFGAPIADRPGADFSVFENGFDDTFLELAFVEVSDNGVDFVRFPAQSETPEATQTGPYGRLDPTNLDNLAGKYRAGYGVPFDLADVGMASATHVRIVDVVGSVDGALGTRDASGRLVNDPYPTNFPSGGFDLDGVAVLGPAETTFSEWASEWLPNGPAGMADDPDGDGKPNLHEYAFEGDPRAVGGGDAVEIRGADGSIELFFHRTPWKTDLSYVVEVSEDLRAWTPVARSEGGGPTASMDGSVSVSEAPAAGAIGVSVGMPSSASRYARVRVIAAAP